jgi:hypothetical protein
MPSKYGNILTDNQLKDLLFEVVQQIDGNAYGKSACWGSLSLVHAVGQGLYFRESNRTGLANIIKLDNPALYSRLSIFFHQNRPEDVENEDS